MKRIFTDVYMYDPDLSAEINEFAAQLDSERTRLLCTNNFPIDYDLVLDIIKTENDETIWAYYYVDHNAKTLFWLHFYECGGSVLREVRGAREPGHVSAYFSVRRLISFVSMIRSIPELRLESLYW